MINNSKIIFSILLIFLMTTSIVFSQDKSKPFDCPIKEGSITSPYGKRDMFGRSFHYGLDFGLPIGSPIYASADGIVKKAYYSKSYGWVIFINHNIKKTKMQTRYAHNSRLLVKAGDRVNKGDLIALSGNTGQSTGPHLHYETRIEGRPVNPMDYTSLDDFSILDYTPSAIGQSLINLVDIIYLALDNTVVIFFNHMNNQILHPLLTNLPIVLKVDLDMTTLNIVKVLHKTLSKLAFKLLPFLVLYYVLKMKYLELTGRSNDFLIETIQKTVKTALFIKTSLFLAGMYLGIGTSIILYFVKLVDNDFSELFIQSEGIVTMISTEGIFAIMSAINFVLFLILFVIVIVRLVDLSLVIVLTPLIIGFAEFIDRGLYIEMKNVYIGIPVAQLVSVISFAFCIGFAKAPPSTIADLGMLGRFIISLTSAFYVVVQPVRIKRIFQINSVNLVNSLIASTKGLMLIDNKLKA